MIPIGVLSLDQSGINYPPACIIIDFIFMNSPFFFSSGIPSSGDMETRLIIEVWMSSSTCPTHVIKTSRTSYFLSLMIPDHRWYSSPFTMETDGLQSVGEMGELGCVNGPGHINGV